MASLSVVIPTHNTRALTLVCLEHLERALALYRRERQTTVEIIVVDDASRDDTLAQIERRFPAVVVLRQPTASGFTSSVNLGLARARGDLLMLLNSDTEIDQHALLRMASVLEDQTVGVVGAQLFYPDGSAQWSGGEEPTLRWLLVLASGAARALSRSSKLYRSVRTDQRGGEGSGGPPARLTGWVSGAAMMFGRDLYESLGPLDERYRFFAQDLDYCSQATRTGKKIAIATAARVLHHLGGSPSPADDRTELLWRDLLTWADRFAEPGFSRKAKTCLQLGGRLALLSSYLDPRCLVPGERREMANARRTSLRRALASL